MNVIKLRGLPWSCTIEDVVKFLHGIKITVKPSDTDTKVPSVYLTTNAEGRPSGEAFIELVDDNDLETALKRNNAMMGQRYIEVFRSTQEQLNKNNQESWSIAYSWSDPVVRLRGLPYECTPDDIAVFFTGLNIAFDGILMVIDFSGRFNGEAFVQFNNILDANKALERHKQKISNRYIEVFRSSRSEMDHYSSNSPQYSQTRAKLPNKMNKRNSHWNNGNEVFKQSAGDFNRNRQKPYSRNINQNTHNRCRGQNQTAPIPSLMANFTEKKSSYNETVPFNSNFCRTGFGVRLRGLPYSVNEAQIRDFFKPLIPVNVILTKGRDGRSSGECEVDFKNQNLASEALKYDKKYIGNRYIEIFALNSGAKIQSPMSISTLMKQDFSTNSNSASLKSNLNTNGLIPFESGISPLPVPAPPPPLMNQQNNIGSLLGPVPSLNQIGNSNMNEIIFADMAKQMTQMYSQFQSQHQFMSGMNMVQANGSSIPSSSNRRF